MRSVAWHPDGKSLSVGTVAGKVHVYEYYEYKGEPRLTCIRELDHRREWISDIKYSPCTPEDPSGGRYLAVGSHDNVVDIYDTKKPNAEYELAGTCKGHSSFITHLGWSKEGNTLYTNSGDYELLFWYAPKGVQIVNGVDVKDVAWADTTGVLGFETTGVWYKEATARTSTRRTSPSFTATTGTRNAYSPPATIAASCRSSARRRWAANPSRTADTARTSPRFGSRRTERNSSRAAVATRRCCSGR